MIRRKFISVGVLLLLFTGIFCGCSRYSVPESEKNSEKQKESSKMNGREDGQKEEEQDPFTKAEEDSQMVYSMSHGAKKPSRNKKGDIKPFIYQGGEFSMEYTFNAEGKGKTIGFLLFVNGKPQRYRIDDNGEEEYCHIFSIADNKDEDFVIHFTPREGKKGETLQVMIEGIYHAGYLPDMKETSGWGFYHSHMPMEYQLKMRADASGDAAAVSKNIMKELKAQEQKVSRKFLTEELVEQGYPEVTTEMLEQGDYHSITYDGRPKFDYLNVKGKKKVHVVYKVCGRSGVAYRTTFFINHQPVSDTADVKFSKGGMAVIEADIDIEALKENGAFYAITVPEYTGRYSESDITLDVLKSNSILLYQKEGN
jgi:hypothetical protein